MIAVEQLVHAPADGYTLLINTPEATMLPFLKKSYRYDPIKDFTPIALVVTSWTVFAVNPKVPANTLQELVAFSKSHTGGVRYGSGGVGGALHVAVEMLRLKIGRQLRARALSRRRAGGDRRDLRPDRNGFDGAGFDPRGRRAANCASWRRPARAGIRCVPDVPTTAEAGLPDVRMDTWFGLAGPPGMPKEIVDADQSRACRDREAAGVSGQADQARHGGGLQAGRRVQCVPGERNQQVAAADSGAGNPEGRLISGTFRIDHGCGSLSRPSGATTWRRKYPRSRRKQKL